MKKFLFPAAICVLAMAMTSCDGYKDKEYEDMFPYGGNQNGEYTQGKAVNLNALYGCNTTWTSPDPFVASVDANGTMTARHVGETWIVGAAQANMYYGVKVNPTVTLFDNPVTTWGREDRNGALKDAYGEDYGAVQFNVGDVRYEARAYRLNAKYPLVADGDEYLFAPYAIAVGEIEDFFVEQTDEETGETVLVFDHSAFYLVENSLVLLASVDGLEDTDLLPLYGSQLTQWYEPINSEGTVPGLTVYNAYQISNATLGVETMPYESGKIFARYFNPKAGMTFVNTALANQAIEAIPAE